MKQLNFWDRLFPPKFDFYEMLTSQTIKTADGITALKHWFSDPTGENEYQLRVLIRDADEIRLKMEACLIEAFVTPFDRQDIYSLSIETDRIIESALSLMELMIAYEVKADDSLFTMVLNLEEGVQKYRAAVELLASAPLEAEKMIADIRRCQVAVEDSFRQGSAALFKTADAIRIVKLSQIYQGMLDAAVYLSRTVDILHKIVVRIA